MKKKAFILIIAGVFLVTISALFFIYVCNDHKECDKSTEVYIDKNGNTVKEEKHICKEKNNL